MDIATIVGFILAYFIISTAIMLGGPFNIFVNTPSLLIVIGGTFAVTLMRVTLANFLGSFKIGLKGFFYNLDAPQNLIDESVELANVARKEGILALEGREIGNGFLERGISLCIDGHAPEVVKGRWPTTNPSFPMIAGRTAPKTVAFRLVYYMATGTRLQANHPRRTLITLARQTTRRHQGSHSDLRRYVCFLARNQQPFSQLKRGIR